MTANVVVNGRVPAEVRHSLEVAAQIKNVTLSAYVADVLTQHAVNLGMVAPISAKSTVVTDRKFVAKQLIDDAIKEYERCRAAKQTHEQACANVSTLLLAYREQQGFMLDEHEQALLDERITALQ